MRLAGLALLLLGCGSSFTAADRETGGSAGMAGDDAGKGGSAGEVASAGAGVGGLVAGAGGVPAGSGGEAIGGAGMPAGGAGAGGMAAGDGGVAGEIVVAGMGGIAGSLAGAAGAAGAEQCGLPYGSLGYKKIDDLEDGDGIVGNGEGDPEPPARFGVWSAGNSAPGLCLQTTGDVTPEQNDSGNLAASTSGFDCPEAWIGFDLHRCGGVSEPYSVAPYSGLTFRYKSTAGVRVLLAGDAALPVSEGHGKNFGPAASWTSATVTWAELAGDSEIGDPPTKPQASGEPRAFDSEQVTGVAFVTGGADFELWIDDVSFL